MNDPEVFEKPCALCKVRKSTRLCDYVVSYNFVNSIIFFRTHRQFKEENSICKHETCDLPMCEDCAVKYGSQVDFCPHHQRLHQQVELPKELQKAAIREKARQLKMYWKEDGK